MFNADPRTLLRLRPLIQRVMVIDPNTAAAKLAGELMKEMGCRQVAYVNKGESALGSVMAFEPQVILSEFAGDDFDGLEFTRQLRRSASPARKAPVIMITAEATAAAILGARNSGVHEFLRKPFTAGDLYRRVANVALKSRPWVEAVQYVGPDRRRFNSGEFAGSKKRRSDAFMPEEADQAS